MMTATEFSDAFDRINAAGGGFCVGDDGDDLNAVPGVGKLVMYTSGDGTVAVYDNGDHYVLVAESIGPWAVRLPKSQVPA